MSKGRLKESKRKQPFFYVENKLKFNVWIVIKAIKSLALSDFIGLKFYCSGTI